MALIKQFCWSLVLVKCSTTVALAPVSNTIKILTGTVNDVACAVLIWVIWMFLFSCSFLAIWTNTPSLVMALFKAANRCFSCSIAVPILSAIIACWASLASLKRATFTEFSVDENSSDESSAENWPFTNTKRWASNPEISLNSFSPSALNCVAKRP